MPKTVDEVLVYAIKKFGYATRSLPYSSPLWGEVSRRIRKRDKNRCRSCSSTKHLDVHHVVKIKNGGTNLPDNLRTLCRVCHRHRHPELRKIKYVS